MLLGEKDKISVVQDDHSFSILPYFIFFGLIFFPGAILGFLLFFIFVRKLKWNPFMNMIPLMMGLLIHFLVLKIVSPFSIEWWPISKELIKPYLWISILLGWLGAISSVWMFHNHINNNPAALHLPGWKEGFKYKKSPFRVAREDSMKENLKEGNCYDEERAPIGILDEPILLETEETFDKEHIVYRYYKEANRHTIITGSTGSGKTITMLNLARNDIITGKPVIMIDMKKSPDTIYFLSKWAKEFKRPFYHFTSGKRNTYWNPYQSNQATYDPLSFGSASSKVDMILGLRKWDTASDVYKTLSTGALQNIFFLLDNVDRSAVPGIPWDESGFNQFIAALDPANLYSLIEAYKTELSMRADISITDKTRLESLNDFYTAITDTRRSSLKEQVENLRGTSRNLIMSSYGEWLSFDSSPRKINFFNILQSKKAPIVLFSLSPLEEPEFAKYMGSLALQDIARAVSYKIAGGSKHLVGLYIDELQGLDIDKIKGILEKGRGAGVFTTISLQSLDQISDVNDLRSLLDTVQNFLVHSGSYGESAERFASIVGKYDKTVYRHNARIENSLFSFNLLSRMNRNVSTATEREWLLPIDSIQSVASGVQKDGTYKSTCYYITKNNIEPLLQGVTNRAIARKVNIIVPEELSRGVPEELEGKLGVPREIQSTEKVRYKDILNEEDMNRILNDDIFKIEPIKETTLPKIKRPKQNNSQQDAIRERNARRRGGK